jgi:hypothetical protein
LKTTTKTKKNLIYNVFFIQKTMLILNNFLHTVFVIGIVIKLNGKFKSQHLNPNKRFLDQLLRSEEADQEIIC